MKEENNPNTINNDNQDIQIVSNELESISKTIDNTPTNQINDNNQSVNSNVQPNVQPSNTLSQEEITGIKVPVQEENTVNQESVQENVNVISNSVNVDAGFNSDATTIGTVKPDKQKSPIAMIFLFGILILFIMFMPNVLELANEYFGTNFAINDGAEANNNEEQKEEETPKVDETYYTIDSSSTIKLDRVEITNFVKDNAGKLNFVIKNTGTVMYKTDKKVYLDFYDDSNTIIGRRYLDTFKEISGGISNNYSLDILGDIENSATKLRLVLRSDDDYPSVTLTNNQLVCEKDNDSITYYFDTNRLTRIYESFTYDRTYVDDVTYSNDLLMYQSRVNNMNSTGITSVLTNNETGFIVTTSIDYNNGAVYSSLVYNTNYYEANTYAKVVSFEMNAKGYICR